MVGAAGCARRVQGDGNSGSDPAAEAVIAFTRVLEDVDRPGADYRLHAEIWLMRADGSGQRRLTNNGTDDYGAAWSPDGRTIAFGATQFAPDGKGGMAATGQRIYLIDPAGGVQDALTDSALRAQFPSWSPDGRTIAFHGSRSGAARAPEIFVVDAGGGGLRQLTDNDWADARPDWSPDGRLLAFQSDRDGTLEIHVMNADGSAPRQLTRHAGPIVNQAPDWSPDGRSIVFQSSREGNLEIHSMAADGTDQVRLTDYPGRDLDPEWSADGRMIVFDRDVSSGPGEVRQLFVMHADGSAQRALTGLPSTNGHAAWRPARAAVPN
jgi:Tol biopolymer transport system component